VLADWAFHAQLHITRDYKCSVIKLTRWTDVSGTVNVTKFYLLTSNGKHPGEEMGSLPLPLPLPHMFMLKYNTSI